MKKLLFLALMLSSVAVLAQSNMRVRGTISSLDGDVLSVKSREGKDLKLTLTPDAQIAVAKKLSLSDIKPGTYVGVTSVSQGGKQVAKEVHLIPPAAPSGHMDWDMVPGAKMPNGTPIIGFDNGDRSALKKGETIWTNARVEGDGKLVTNRVQVSKGGVK